MYFAGSSVVGGSEAPHPVVRGPVSSFNVEDKVLDEGDLILTWDDLESGSGHLDKDEEVERDDSNLKEVDQQWGSIRPKQIARRLYFSRMKKDSFRSYNYYFAQCNTQQAIIWDQ